MSNASISKSVVWQLSSKFALQGMIFFTTPIFTRILSSADYGYISLFQSWVSIFMLVLGLQTYGSIGNARIKLGEDKMPEYLSSIMTLSLCSLVLLFPFLIIFADKLSVLLGLKKDMVYLCFIYSFSSYVVCFVVGKYDAFKQVEKSTIVSIIQSLSSISLSLIFVVIFSNNKALAKIYGQAIPVILLSIFFIVKIYIEGKKIWNSHYIKYCLTLSVPLILHGLGHVIFAQCDRIMLNKMMGASFLGVYSVAFSLCSVLSIIYGALNSAWVPFYYDYKKKGDTESILLHSKRYIKFFLLISMGFLLLSTDVFKIMAPEEYWDGIKIIPIFVISHFFNFLYLFPINYEFFSEKTKLIPIGTLLASVVNLIINFCMIPRYGITGAAVGTLIAHILLFLFHFLLSKNIKSQKFDYSLIFFIPYTLLLVCVAPVICIYFSELYIARWSMALGIAIYLFYDIIKKRSIF